ncbi:MAG: hypothetical protein B6I24_10515 [Bacteroidetes bacterium 4572_128]|nr:MAG: hypothetical protein B6I24_10515 [Bacteroidetes bacterium 4572_128]
MTKILTFSNFKIKKFFQKNVQNFNISYAVRCFHSTIIIITVKTPQSAERFFFQNTNLCFNILVKNCRILEVKKIANFY